MVMTGQSFFPEVMQRLIAPPELRFWWLGNYNLQTAGTLQRHRFVRTAWKPLLWIMREPARNTRLVTDVVNVPPLPRDGKTYHHWGQNVGGVYEWLRPFVRPGDLVCDPFLGGGAHAIAALQHGCRFVGADSELSCIETTEQRLKSFQPRLVTEKEMYDAPRLHA